MGVGWEGKWLAHLLIYAPPVLDYMSSYIIVLYSLRQLVSPIQFNSVARSNINARSARGSIARSRLFLSLQII